MYKLVLLFFLLFQSSVMMAQTFFFVETETDTLSNDFYEYNKHFSILYQANIPEHLFGLSLFLHNEQQRLSYYFECKTNYKSSMILEGKRTYTIAVNGEDVEMESVVKKRTTYSDIIFGVGIGTPVLKNVLIFGSLGMKYRLIYNNSNPDRGYYFHYGNTSDLHLAFGALYVTSKGISMLGGLDIITKTLNVGLGVTF